MCRACGVDNEGFHVSYVCKQGEYLKGIDKAERLFPAALYIKGKYARAAVRKIFFVQIVLRVVGQRGVLYLGNVFAL